MRGGGSRRTAVRLTRDNHYCQHTYTHTRTHTHTNTHSLSTKLHTAGRRLIVCAKWCVLVVQEEILAVVHRLNNDVAVNGILVQLPLPPHCNADRVIAALHPLKDADGLTQSSAGALLLHGLSAPLIPCTPLGCIQLLDAYNIPIEGKHAVVIGRSNLVGKPVAQLLLSRNATVTTVHSKTTELAEHVRRADIVVAAIGKAEWVQADWLKQGAVVVDVGINAKDDASKKLGYRLVGDVDYERAKHRVTAITPVPGGVGPMTVAMLIQNTVKAYRLQKEQRTTASTQ